METTELMKAMEQTFKYLDIVQVVRQEEGIVKLDDAFQNVDFLAGSVGRVIDKNKNVYSVWIPVPGSPDKGLQAKLASVNLRLVRRMTEQEHMDQWAPSSRAAESDFVKEAPRLDRSFVPPILDLSTIGTEAAIDGKPYPFHEQP